jgi:hypothetical protein
MKYLLSVSAFGGVFLGAYLMALAYTTKLGSPAAGNIVILSGLVLFSGCSLYLMLKIIKRLTK